MSASEAEPTAIPTKLSNGEPAALVAISAAQKPSPSLESLVQAAEPLVRAYFASQHETQARELDFEEKVLNADTRLNRMLIVSATSIAIVVLCMAGSLMF